MNPTATDIYGTITLAQLAAVALSDERADQAQDARNAREGFDIFVFTAADTTARTILGYQAAELLEWHVTEPANRPEGKGEAVAVVAADPASVLVRFLIDAEATTTDAGNLELLRTCGHCGGERAYSITSLAQLGELLETDPGDGAP